MKKLNSEKPRLIPYWVLGLFTLATVALFYNSLRNPFILDDLVKIVNNVDIRNLNRISETLVYPYDSNPTRNRNDPSRPLVFSIYTLLYHFWSIHSFPYHIVNTVVHFGNVVLIYLLASLFFKNRYAALTMALLFLVLPIQAGTVIYIYGLSDLLSGFFMLLAFYIFLRNKSVLNSCLVAFLYVLSLASKQIGIVLPFILGLYEFTFPKGRDFQYSKHGLGLVTELKSEFLKILSVLWPFFLVTFIYIISRYFYLGGVGDIEGFHEVQDQISYFSVQGWVILKYIQLTLVPMGLTIDHGIISHGNSEVLLFVSWSIVLVIGFTGLRLIRSLSVEKRVIGFGVLFYFGILLPTTILPTVDCLVERRVYLANFGLLIAVIGTALNLRHLKWLTFQPKFGNWKSFVWVVLLLVYFTVSFKRNEVFASERHVWEESLAAYPGYSRALINTAWMFVVDKEYDRGLDVLKMVHQYLPNNTEVLAKIGMIYDQEDYAQKSLETALSYFQQSVQVDPNYYIGRYLAARVLFKLGRLNESKETLLKAIENNKGYSPAYLLLGQIAKSQNNLELSESYFKIVRQMDPDGKPY